MPDVSVIIPVYNTEEYIGKCLESVLDQTHSNIEIVCVLDGPTDQSGEIVNRYAERDSRIVIVEQLNRGLSAARNAGIQKASGKYVAFVDSDDWVAPEYVEQLYNAANTTGAGMAICNFYSCGDRITTGPPLPSGIHDPITICRELVFDNLIYNFAWNKLIKKSIFEDHGILFPVGLLFEDMAIMCRIAYYAEKVVLINDPLYYYRSRPTSIIRTYNRKYYFDLLIALGHVKRFLIEHEIYPLFQREFEYNCTRKLLDIARIITRKHPEHKSFLREIRSLYVELIGGKGRISLSTRRLMSVHNRISTALLVRNPLVYNYVSTKKWI